MERSPAVTKRRRILKACASCRSSKVRCDGGKPCTRCRSSNVECDYMTQVIDPVREKLAQIEEQMQSLSSRIPPGAPAPLVVRVEQQALSPQQTPTSNLLSPRYSSDLQQPVESGSPVTLNSANHHGSLGHEYAFSSDSARGLSAEPGSSIGLGNPYSPNASNKRKRDDFELKVEPSLDVVTRGVITYEEADLFFRAFFRGCDKYVPVFDINFDTFTSVRARSSILFDIMCKVGCRAENGPASAQHQALSNATKSPICDIILGTVPASIETVQALLVDACYSEKGWVLTSIATRMAMDLDLPRNYTEICSRFLESQTSTSESNKSGEITNRDEMLFRHARVWFGTFILEHILSLDCGKDPGISATGELRRCRVLLKHPSRTLLDLRLLAQVELNAIRAQAHSRLSSRIGLSDRELSEIVQGTRIDLSIWLSDWMNIVEGATSNEEERASLIVNLKIQRDWGEMTMLCKGLQGMGIDNLAIMSEEQRNFIHLAKVSAERHLTTIISNPDAYLANFRYGMDFVWAKCAFSVLLLLKLARLLPEISNMSQLIANSKILLSELSKALGPSNVYFRILHLSVDKCERALKEDLAQTTDVEGQAAITFPEAELDFQSYVPKEFIQDWSFPGLTLCWVPFDFQDMFMDFGTGF